MCMFCGVGTGISGFGSEEAFGYVAGTDAAAPASLGVAGRIEQLRTSWGGFYEGKTLDWSGSQSINYYIGEAPHSTSEGENPFWTRMTTAMQGVAEMAFELWDDLISIDLNRSLTSAQRQIQFQYADKTWNGTTYGTDGGSYAHSRDLSTTGRTEYGNDAYNMGRSEVWLNSNWWTHDQDSDLWYGGYGVFTYIHEIGHALGLSHPGSYNFDPGQTRLTYERNAEYAEDTRQYSVMSYFGGYRQGTGWVTDDSIGTIYHAATPMVDDISAIQAMYGVDTSTRAGNTTYGFNSTAGRSVFDFNAYGGRVAIFTIWDSAGTDTLDTSGFHGKAQTIDLRDGNYSSVGGYSSNIAIARGAVIENAIGSSGNDTMFGNGSANRLEGGFGDDILNGLAGTDTMIGGGGNDTYLVDNIGDIVTELSGQGYDTVYIAANHDMAANVEALFMNENGLDLRTNGNGLANTITGNAGNNYINGGLGIDRMTGGGGNDTYGVDNSYDSVVEAAGGGSDTVYASVDYHLSGNVETLILTGSAVQGFGDASNNQIFGNAGVNVLHGRGGNDYLLGLGGNDIFVITPENGAVDTIGDFAGAGIVGGDRISFSGFGAGAFVTQVSQTSFLISSADRSIVQQFILQGHNGAALASGDYYFS